MGKLDSIVSARIHPAIGVARVGNSLSAESRSPDTWFYGPEVPYPVRRPSGFSYRDDCGRIKRQAARFRVYGYDDRNQVVQEITCCDADIKWMVHVANKKAAWYDFIATLDLNEAAAVQSPRRNGQIRGADRTKKLIIDPGPHEIEGPGARPVKLVGRFFDWDVPLGELQTDDQGRLRFLGGHGKSGTPFAEFVPPSTFANNAGWHDDMSDGPVEAMVTLKDSDRRIPTESAWVVTAPPDYAPDLVASQSMYEVILDACKGFYPKPKPGTPPGPSFTWDILPLFRHFQDAQWLNSGFLSLFGWKGLIDFARCEIVEMLADKSDRSKELRMLVLNNFRNPGAADFQPSKWPPIFGDAFGNFDAPPVPKVGLAITPTSYQKLQEWAAGNFDADYQRELCGKGTPSEPSALEDWPDNRQPGMLDRAALTYCIGGPFHPGCEMTWPMRQPSMYRAPFRLRRRSYPDEPDYGDILTQAVACSKDGPLSSSGPGDLTKWMAVPWQTDTASCGAGYTSGTEFPLDPLLPSFWPSRVPNHVLTEESYSAIANAAYTGGNPLPTFHDRKDWLRKLNPDGPSIDFKARMVHEWHAMGIVERREVKPPIPGLPDVMYVETLPHKNDDCE